MPNNALSSAASLVLFVDQFGNNVGDKTNPLAVINRSAVTLGNVTINSGTSLSSALSLSGVNLLGLIVPTTWVTASISFLGSVDGITFFPIYDGQGNPYRIDNCVPGSYVPLTPMDMQGLVAIKLQSGLPSSPINQPSNALIFLSVG